MIPVCHIRMGSTGVRAPVWNASGMGHWKRLIKIPGGTDCYYWINHMTCSTHVYYCPFIFVTIPDLLSTIMTPVYLVPRSSICYTPCGNILFMAIYILCVASIPLYVYLTNISIVYTQHSSVVMLHTAHLHVPFYHVTTIYQSLLYKTGYYCRHDPMITC